MEKTMVDSYIYKNKLLIWWTVLRNVIKINLGLVKIKVQFTDTDQNENRPTYFMQIPPYQIYSKSVKWFGRWRGHDLPFVCPLCIKSSSVSMDTKLRPGRPGFNSRMGQWWDFFLSSPRPDRLWGQHSLLSSGYWGSYPGSKKGQAIKLTTHLHTVSMLRMPGGINPLPKKYSWRGT
jgi:hypothetical protein